MKVLVLTSTAERHHHFAIRIIRETGAEVAVIQEPKGVKARKRGAVDRARRYIKQPALVRNALLNRIFAHSLGEVEREKRETEKGYFGTITDAERKLLTERTLMTLEKGKTVNDPDVVDLIKGWAPDIIAVMGTSLVRAPVIKVPRLGILNIHTGLSPYYRGGRTNFWPFLYGELGRCGVTIHRLDTGIDSGDIIYHAIPEIRPEDTYSSINCKMILEGTKLMVRAIRDLAEGSLSSQPQWGEGRLFYNRDYNGYAAFRYLRKRRRAIREFLASPTYPDRLMLPGKAHR